MQNQIIRALDTHPVCMTTILPGFSVATDWESGAVEMRNLLDVQTGPVFLIIDVRQMSLSIDDLMLGASKGSRGSEPLWHHPNVRGVCFISGNKLVAIAVAGLHSPVFGNIEAKVYSTLEDALVDIEQKITA